MRTLRCGMTFCGESFAATLRVPDEYFDERGVPRWNLLNARFSGQPIITWDRPVGGVPKDEQIVFQATHSIPIGEELQKLHEVVASLEKKCDG
jgi:hypothetical protein